MHVSFTVSLLVARDENRPTGQDLRVGKIKHGRLCSEDSTYYNVRIVSTRVKDFSPATAREDAVESMQLLVHHEKNYKHACLRREDREATEKRLEEAVAWAVGHIEAMRELESR